MAPLILLLLTVLVNSAASAPDFLNSFNREIKDDITLMKHPVDETVFGVAFSQCQNVKKIVGVHYDQVQGTEYEPDVNILTMEYRTPDFRSIFNISSVSRELPKISDFMNQGKVVLYIHGFVDDPRLFSFPQIADSFLQHGYNSVLALDGSPLIRWFYLRSSTYVRFMGNKVGETLASIYEKGINPKNIMIVGHSLGSHIAGFAGQTFKKLTGHKIARITALDPAGPCFADVGSDLKLNKEDAEYVDVIHTDAGVYGLKENLGHADYWVNGGNKEPGCTTSTCSHCLANTLYAESVTNPAAFPAIKCKDWDTFKKGKCDTKYEISYMGLPSKAEGVFYLRTADKKPYGLGMSGIKFDKNDQSFGVKVVDSGYESVNTITTDFSNKFGRLPLKSVDFFSKS